ncbi:unnamed protein product [Microthlaspi erraticum]|uniref:Uncharacterized protein n=1 Tax=Microthlaspi erraticum TaxID=1685480 RepID=A0A6D2HIS7_9BRAS|nr:unnamed protein product [Microthlaspi erraticum]
MKQRRTATNSYRFAQEYLKSTQIASSLFSGSQNDKRAQEKAAASFNRDLELSLPITGPNRTQIELDSISNCCVDRHTPCVARHNLQNSTVFKQIRYEPSEVCVKGLEEASIWCKVNYPGLNSDTDWCPQNPPGLTWTKPPINILKCNIGVSWVGPHRHCGI